MKCLQIMITVFLVVVITSCSSKEILQKRSIALINNVSFTDKSFNNPNASNGFLVAYKDKTYGITAKHILMISKTDKMKVVDFEGDLQEWKMHPKNDSTSYVVMDKLLNVNRKDSLDWNYISANWNDYDDWLVFSIKEDKGNYQKLPFRNKALTKGETVFAIGWTYKDTIGEQRTYEYIYDKTVGNYLQLIQLKGPKNLGGLSGAPVVDSEGKLVGLVSSGGEDAATNQIVLQATSTKNILKFLGTLN